MYFNEFINNRRKELGMSIDELVKKSGVPKGTLSKITSGINTNPTLTTVEAICKALKCTLNDAVGTGVSQSFSATEMTTLKKYRALDEHGKEIVDSVLEIEYKRCSKISVSSQMDAIRIRMSTLAASAGTGEYLDDESYRMISIKRTDAAEQADFAVKVNGRSMEDTYYDGDVLLVESTQDINIGEIGVFTVNGEGYVKEYGGDRLISHNDEYDDIMLHEYDDFRCSGRVIGVAELVK